MDFLLHLNKLTLLGVGKTMDVNFENLKSMMEPKWAHFGCEKSFKTSNKVMELMNAEKFRLAASGGVAAK